MTYSDNSLGDTRDGNKTVPPQVRTIYSQEMLNKASQNVPKSATDHAIAKIDVMKQRVSAAILYAKSLPTGENYALGNVLQTMRLLQGRLDKMNRECAGRLLVVLVGLDGRPLDDDSIPREVLNRISAIQDMSIYGDYLDTPSDEPFEAIQAVEDLWHHVAVATMSIELSVSNRSLSQKDAVTKVQELECLLRMESNTCLTNIQNMLATLVPNSKKARN